MPASVLDTSLRSVDETSNNSRKVRTRRRITIKDMLISSFVDVEEPTNMTDYQQKSLSAFEDENDWAEFQRSCAKAHVTTTGKKRLVSTPNTIFQTPYHPLNLNPLDSRKSRYEGDTAAISQGQSLSV